MANPKNMTEENNTQPSFSPDVVEEQESQAFVASQWKLVWWRFRKHKLAVVGGIVTLLIYLLAGFAEFVAPYAPDRYDGSRTYAPPQPIHLFDTSEGITRFYPQCVGNRFNTGYNRNAPQIPV